MAKFCPRFPAFTCNVFWGCSCSVINWTLLTFLHASNDLPSLDRHFHVWCRNPLTIKANTINWNRLARCPRLRSSSCYSPRNNWWKARNHLYVWGRYCSRDLCFSNCWLFCPLKKFFPPVVTGSLITIIGFTLVPVGFQDLGGGTPTAASFGDPANLIIGFLTIAIILLFNAFARGFMKSIAILLGILISSFIAGALGFVSLKPVSEAAWFHAPQLFFFGVPRFDMSAMITMILVSLTTMIESTGVFFALSDITGRQLTTNDLERGYRAEGIAAILGGLFNTFPYSTFSENVGVLKMSGVKSRQPVYYAAFLLLLLGLLPKVGALATVIPEPVLGGAMIVMFGMVGVQGVQILHKVDFSNNANLLTASVSIGLGLGITMYPQLFQHMPTEFQIILGNGIVVTSLSAVLLNLLFNHRWANHD